MYPNVNNVITSTGLVWRCLDCERMNIFSRVIGVPFERVAISVQCDSCGHWFMTEANETPLITNERN